MFVSHHPLLFLNHLPVCLGECSRSQVPQRILFVRPRGFGSFLAKTSATLSSPHFHVVLHCFSGSPTLREHCPGSAVTHQPPSAPSNYVFQPLLALLLCVSLCGCCFSPSHTCLISYTCTEIENLRRASNLFLLLLFFYLFFFFTESSQDVFASLVCIKFRMSGGIQKPDTPDGVFARSIRFASHVHLEIKTMKNHEKPLLFFYGGNAVQF